MIELNDIEVEQVSGAVGLVQLLQWGNYALEFFTGFVDGLNAGTGS